MAVGRQVRKRRLGVEDEYWQLILAGMGTVEACELIGIGRKTGYRCRTERGGLPPLRRVERQRSDCYLSLLERQRIATLRRQGLSMREIALDNHACIWVLKSAGPVNLWPGRNGGG